MGNRVISAKYVWSPDPATGNSTSAGAFYLIAREFLKAFGDRAAVYGCAFDGENRVVHIRVDRADELGKLQGSKYVQSDTSGIYGKLLADLKRGFNVLFSGTACQTAAAYKFAGDYGQRLYTVDVLCHGVPSPVLWEKYVASLEDRYGGRLTNIRFRNKSGTNRLGYLLKFKVNGRAKTIYPSESGYYTAFLDGASLRPCCYNCPFVGDYEYADLTVADSNNKDFHPSQAISLVLVRSEKGQRLYDMIKHLLESVDAEYGLERNVNRKLAQPTERPTRRDTFYEESHLAMANKASFAAMAKSRLKAVVPTSLKDAIRRTIKR